MYLSQKYFEHCISQVENNLELQNRIIDSIYHTGNTTIVLSNYGQYFPIVDSISYNSVLIRDDFWNHGKNFLHDIENEKFQGYQIVGYKYRNWIFFLFGDFYKSYSIVFRKKPRWSWLWF